MAHPGQEGALGLVGPVGRGTGLLQFRLDPAQLLFHGNPLRNVAGHAQQGQNLAPGIDWGMRTTSIFSLLPSAKYTVSSVYRGVRPSMAARKFSSERTATSGGKTADAGNPRISSGVLFTRAAKRG